jgi:ankyrin repeat protein
LLLICVLIICSRSHRTALHFAVQNGHTAVCELLIACKDEVNAKDL